MKAILTLTAGLLFSGLAQAEFVLGSKDIEAGKHMQKAQEFAGFGCDGDNRSPELHWSGAPEGTKSFALTVYDPDAPTGSGWWHWVIFNIPADATSLPADAGNPTKKLAPAGSVQSRTDFGQKGFGGACPPKGHGLHHYQFTLYALDVEKFDIDPDSSAAFVGYNINFHTLGKTSLEALYER